MATTTFETKWITCHECAGQHEPGDLACDVCDGKGGWTGTDRLDTKDLEQIESAHACNLDGCIVCRLLAEIHDLRKDAGIPA